MERVGDRVPTPAQHHAWLLQMWLVLERALLKPQRRTLARELTPLPCGARIMVCSCGGLHRAPALLPALVPCHLFTTVIRVPMRAPSRAPLRPAQTRAQGPVLSQRAGRLSGPAALAALAAAQCYLRCVRQAAEAAPVQAAWAPGAAALPALPGPSALLPRWAVRRGPGPRRRAIGRRHPAGSPPAPCAQDCSASARSPGSVSRAYSSSQGALCLQRSQHLSGILHLRPDIIWCST